MSDSSEKKIYFEGVINSVLPPKKQTMAYLIINCDEMIFYKKSSLPDMIGGLIWNLLRKARGEGNELARFYLKDIYEIEKKRYGININCFQVKLKNKDNYILIFDRPKEKYKLLKEILTDVTFINFWN